MDYYHKYLKYKNKYIQLSGGSNKFNLKSQIDEIINQDKINNKTKTHILAHVLKLIMNWCGIDKSEYMIMASYCLKDIREVGDLDVIVIPSAYQKLRLTGIFEVSQAKMSTGERLEISLKSIDPEASIEIFGWEPTQGFPSDYFSLSNLQGQNLLVEDEFSNPYFGIRTCINLYSDLEKVGSKYIIPGTHIELDEARVRKNISHLEKIRDGYSDIRIKSLCEEKIDYLNKILSESII